MTSCILFHGPGARQATLEEANRIGRLMAPPYGDNGLKVDEAREFVSQMLSAPLGAEVGVVIAGPMDQTTHLSSDVLLKVIEEFNADVMRPLLWAHDIGGVMKTLRSRCLDRWCPATGNEPVDEELEQTAFGLLEAVLGGQSWKVPPLVQKVSDRLPQLLSLLAEALLVRMGEKAAQELWGRVRAVSYWWNPTVIEVVAALFPEGNL